MIEHLKSNKLRLTAELDKSNDQAAKATELKQLAEEEVTQLKSIVQAFEMDKQNLQEEVRNLMGIVEYLRSTTVKSVNEFTTRLKLDLNLVAGE